MAIWHFRAYLIPRDELIRRCGFVSDSLESAVFDDHRWWIDENALSKVSSCLGSFFGPEDESKNSVRKWQDDGHSITTHVDSSGALELVAAKADARLGSCRSFLQKVSAAARELECVLYLSSMEVIEPSETEINRAFEMSAAHGFLANPKETLSDSLRMEFERNYEKKERHGN